MKFYRIVKTKKLLILPDVKWYDYPSALVLQTKQNNKTWNLQYTHNYSTSSLTKS